jgi:hypothetical protein
LFQRLLLFGQQACVLDRDHRLIGEALQKQNLGMRERPDLVAIRTYETEQSVVLAK